LLRYVLKNKLSLDPARDVKIARFGEQPDILPALQKGIVDGAILATPPRLIARKMGFRELLDLDELGIQIPYVGISSLKASFKTNRAKSILVTKKYLRGASDEILEEMYEYFSSKAQTFPFPSIEAIRTALDILSDEYPKARSVDPQEVADLSFVKQVESSGVR